MHGDEGNGGDGGGSGERGPENVIHRRVVSMSDDGPARPAERREKHFRAKIAPSLAFLLTQIGNPT